MYGIGFAVAAAALVGIGLLVVGAIWIVPVVLFLLAIPLFGMALIQRVRGLGSSRGSGPSGVPTTAQASYDPKSGPNR